MKLPAQAVAAAWQEQFNRLQRASSFFDLVEALFTAWNLMAQEVEEWQAQDPIDQIDPEQLYSAGAWNRRTAFRDYLTLLHQQLQHLATTPVRTLWSPERCAGYPPEEVEVIRLVQELVPNHLQAWILQRMATQMLCIYWAKLAARSPLGVPGFLTTALYNPLLLAYEPERLRVSVESFLRLQKSGQNLLQDAFAEWFGLKVSQTIPIAEIVFERLAHLYLAASAASVKEARIRLEQARGHLSWMLQFLGGANPGGPLQMQMNDGQPTLPGLIAQIRQQRARDQSAPVQLALMPSFLALLNNGRLTLMTFPPWSSFWSKQSGHPFLSLIDERIAQHVFVENVDLRETLFFDQCRTLQQNLTALAGNAARYEFFRAITAMVTRVEALNSRWNRAFTAMFCTFLASTLTAEIGEDKKTWSILVGTLGAGANASLPLFIQNLAKALARHTAELGDESLTPEYSSTAFEKRIYEFLQVEPPSP